MNKVYYLSTCDTCRRILKSLEPHPELIKQDLKEEPISEDQLEFLYAKIGSYEKLFNKRAQLYRTRDLKNKNLKEEDFKKLLLEHYTFLKRPVFIIADEVYAGNSKKVIEQVKKALNR